MTWHINTQVTFVRVQELSAMNERRVARYDPNMGRYRDHRGRFVAVANVAGHVVRNRREYIPLARRGIQEILRYAENRLQKSRDNAVRKRRKRRRKPRRTPVRRPAHLRRRRRGAYRRRIYWSTPPGTYARYGTSPAELPSRPRRRTPRSRLFLAPRGGWRDEL